MNTRVLLEQSVVSCVRCHLHLFNQSYWLLRQLQMCWEECVINWCPTENVKMKTNGNLTRVDKTKKIFQCDILLSQLRASVNSKNWEPNNRTWLNHVFTELWQAYLLNNIFLGLKRFGQICTFHSLTSILYFLFFEKFSVMENLISYHNLSRVTLTKYRNIESSYVVAEIKAFKNSASGCCHIQFALNVYAFDLTR